MDAPGDKTFNCTVIAPTGRLLDCQSASVVFPAHDGQVGVLYNHMPMFCQLGLGIVKVRSVAGDQCKGPSKSEPFLLVDGGFVLLAFNSLTIVAYDAISLHDAKAEKIESMIDAAVKNLAQPALTYDQRLHEAARLALLRQFAQLSQNPLN